MTTCFCCATRLDENKRVVFDPANARLWGICPKCGQWNMTALDEEERRAEIEKLERVFAGATCRRVVEGVGLAELPGGATVYRVGHANQGVFVAWRYLNRMSPRQVLQWIGVFAIVVFGQQIGNFLMANMAATAVTVAGTAATWFWILRRRVLTRVQTGNGRFAKVRVSHAERVRLVGTELRVPHDGGESVVREREAVRVMAELLAFRGDVVRAVELIERFGGLREMFLRLTPEAQRTDADREGILFGRSISLPLRVLLENEAHQPAERRVIDAELATLRQEAREAEGVARIVDQLT